MARGRPASVYSSLPVLVLGWLCGWISLWLCVSTPAEVLGQALSSIPPALLADLYSFPAGPWLVRDNSSTLLPSKRGAEPLPVGVIVTLPGGPDGYKLGQDGAVASPSWCLAAGYAAAVMDTNADPAMLPNHQLQLLFSDDGYDPAKAVELAQEIYTTTTPYTNQLNQTTAITPPVIIGSLTMDIAQSIAAVARFHNVPFVSYWTDSSLLPPATYPTLLSHAESYDTIASSMAQFVFQHGWQRVATLTTLSVDVVAEAAHFALTAESLGIQVSSREAFDSSLGRSATTNPSLGAAVARLKASNVRIMFLGCTQVESPMVLEALDSAGMMGPNYFYVGDNCVGGAIYSDLGVRKPHIFASLLTSIPNTIVPDSPTRVQAFGVDMTRRYQESPDAMFRCNPALAFNLNLITAGYQYAQAVIAGLDSFHTIKQQCQQPDNQQRLQQALPLQQAKAMPQPLDCVAAMSNTSWNTPLGITCCKLDVQRSPYYRPHDPFGTGAYVNGEGPVLLDALRSVRIEGIIGPIGIQSPGAPVANLAFVNLLVDSTGLVSPVARQIYRSTSCNVTTNVCQWNVTTVSPPTFGDGTTNPPDDGVIRYVATIHPSTAGRGVLLALAALGMVACGLVSVVVWRYRELKSIKSSSITFVMLILASAITCLSTVASLYRDDDTSSCRARVWLGHISFSVLFGSLLLKTHRLAHIFDNRALRVKAKSDRHLLGLLGIYVVVVCAILISWMARHAPTVQFRLQADGRAGYYRCQSSAYEEMWALLGVHSAALAWGIYLCVKCQDVFAELNESKQIASSIYNVALLSALIVGIDQGLDYYNVDITFYLYAAGIVLGSVCTVSLLMGPKLLDVYRCVTHSRSGSGFNKQLGSEKQKPNMTRLSVDMSELGNTSMMTEGTGTTTAATVDGSKRPSIVGGATAIPQESTSRVSDLGLNMTAADWMKVTVFARKCYEGAQHNNIDRVMLAHNQVHAMLLQIYRDAHQTKQQEQPAPPQHQQHQQQPPQSPSAHVHPSTRVMTKSTLAASSSDKYSPDPSVHVGGSGGGRGSTNKLASVSGFGSGAVISALPVETGTGVPPPAFSINERGARCDDTGSMHQLMDMHHHQQQAHHKNKRQGQGYGPVTGSEDGNGESSTPVAIHFPAPISASVSTPLMPATLGARSSIDLVSPASVQEVLTSTHDISIQMDGSMSVHDPHSPQYMQPSSHPNNRV